MDRDELWWRVGILTHCCPLTRLGFFPLFLPLKHKYVLMCVRPTQSLAPPLRGPREGGERVRVEHNTLRG